MSKGEQKNVYYVFGKLLNVALKDSTADKDLRLPSLVTMDDIMNSTKAEAYSKIDSRLRNFIDGITELQDQSANKVNFKYNAVENLLKARDNNFVSKTDSEHRIFRLEGSGLSTCNMSNIHTFVMLKFIKAYRSIRLRRT